MRAETARELFHFLAKQIELFLQIHHSDRLQAHLAHEDRSEKDNFLQLGFTFSFAFKQQSLNAGTLLYWTKGFDIPDAIGQNVCALLQEQIDELHVPVNVAALVNDTVGTLVARSYQSPGATTTLLGAIFGTGTNGAYVEKLENITKLKLPQNDGSFCQPTGDMILNTEWGSFDNELSILPNTPYDIAVDQESVHPGIQMFEKRVSGMFLGETLRHALLAIAPHSSTMVIPALSPLYEQYSIGTSFLSSAASDNSSDLKIIRQEVKQILDIDTSREDAEAIKKLALAINKRAARLAGVAIAAVVLKSGRLSHATASPPLGTTKNKLPLTSSTGEKFSAYPKSRSLLALYRRMLSTFRRWHSLAFPPHKMDDVPTTSSTTPGIIDVGVDGSLIEFCPGFEDSIRSTLRDIEDIGVDGEKRVRIGIAKDGSGIGAALIARMACLKT